MTQGTLLPNLFEVKLICLRPKDGAIQMELQACRTFSACPLCGTPSGRVHSRYTRRLGDLPWDGCRFAFCCQPGSFSARAMDAGDASLRSRFQASHHDMPGGLFGQLRL